MHTHTRVPEVAARVFVSTENSHVEHTTQTTISTCHTRMYQAILHTTSTYHNRMYHPPWNTISTWPTYIGLNENITVSNWHIYSLQCVEWSNYFSDSGGQCMGLIQMTVTCESPCLQQPSHVTDEDKQSITVTQVPNGFQWLRRHVELGDSNEHRISLT